MTCYRFNCCNNGGKKKKKELEAIIPQRSKQLWVASVTF